MGDGGADRVPGRAVTAFVDGLLAMTLAPSCAACHNPLEHPLQGPVCATCWSAIVRPSPPWCRVCGDPLPAWRVISLEHERCPRCRRRPGLIVSGRTVGPYEGTLRDIIHTFKYEGRSSLAEPLAALIRAAGDDLLADADYVVPVPLHPWRRLRRGFNQAAALAVHLGPPMLNAVWRVRAARQQMGLTAAVRRRNVRDVMRLSPFVNQRLCGRIVVIVDDVRTTGATLEACAKILSNAGAREVRAMTIAVARK